MWSDRRTAKEFKYVKYYGKQVYHVSLSDWIQELTPELYYAMQLLRLEDARKIARECVFKCNCGECDDRGLILKLTIRKPIIQKDGITHGHVKSDTLEQRQDHISCYFTTKIIEEYRGDSTGMVFAHKLAMEKE